MLYVVTGPPCSGKTTHVREHRAEGDVVIDADALAFALGYPDEQVDWDTQHPAREVARAARRAAVDQAIRLATTCDVWVIDSQPHRTSLRIYERAGAELIELDPGQSECRDRATRAGRAPSTLEQIAQWYDAVCQAPR